MVEVAYHMTAALDIVDRREAERELLAGYLDALRANGVSPPEFDEAWLQYRQFLAYGYFIYLINEISFQTEAVNTACAARFGAAMLDHDVRLLLGA